ncbi:hypothetical protein, partial [Chryseobacterium sp.]|uniref:hypothetical protein n=1 Tax=Chryseobacterium sp. TaxID=1871047 RepID=UPI0025BD3DE8
VSLARNTLVNLLRNQLITFAGLGWSILKDSTPHPISCIFDFFWYLKLMINPDMVQQRKYEYY